MSIMDNESLRDAGEFAEGTVSISAGTWFCLSHSASIRAGRECPWCVWETVGETEFYKWASKHQKGSQKSFA